MDYIADPKFPDYHQPDLFRLPRPNKKKSTFLTSYYSSRAFVFSICFISFVFLQYETERIDEKFGHLLARDIISRAIQIGAASGNHAGVVESLDVYAERIR
jgi:hypothetical protein